MERLRALSRTSTPGALTILRVVTGFVMAVHGWLKLTDYAGWKATLVEMGIPAPDVFAALSTAAELAGGIGLILGLLTPIAAFAVLVNMLVAIFVVHREGGLLAQNGGFEYPLIVAAVMLFFLVRGGGPISLDALLFRERGEPRERRPRAPFRREVPV